VVYTRGDGEYIRVGAEKEGEYMRGAGPGENALDGIE
jgi:hypothetical protein